MTHKALLQVHESQRSLQPYTSEAHTAYNIYCCCRIQRHWCILMLQGFNKSDATEVDIAVQECCDIIQSIMAVGLEKALSGVRA